MKLWRAVREFFRTEISMDAVDADRLLLEAKRDLIHGQDVLLFNRMLSDAEVRALKKAWEERYTGPY